MKNLANCKPSEFLAQTYRIKKTVENWLTSSDLVSLRKRFPTLDKIDDTMTDEEKKKVRERNLVKMQEQGLKNTMEMLDSLMGEHAEDTLAVLALCCFVEPEHVDDHPIEFYLESLDELISNRAVVSFFTSLASLGRKNSPSASAQ